MIVKIIADVVALLLFAWGIQNIYETLYENICEAYKKNQITSYEFFRKKRAIETLCVIMFMALMILTSLLIHNTI